MGVAAQPLQEIAHVWGQRSGPALPLSSFGMFQAQYGGMQCDASPRDNVWGFEDRPAGRTRKVDHGMFPATACDCRLQVHIVLFADAAV